jgi:Bacterial Ig-like domain (group 1)
MLSESILVLCLTNVFFEREQYMKKIVFLNLILLSFLMFTSCDDDSPGTQIIEPSLSLSTLELSPVKYVVDDEIFSSDAIVVVLDEEGNPLAGRFVSLTGSQGATIRINFSATEVLTNDMGEAVFELTSTHIFDSTISAYASNETIVIEDSTPIDNTALVEFNAGLTVSVLGSTLDLEKGTFEINAHFTDGYGDISGTLATFYSLDQSDVLSSTELTTNSSGDGTFLIESNITGIHDLSFNLPGIVENLFGEAGFYGPELSGIIDIPMSYGFLDNPTVSLIAIEIGNNTFSILGEANTSEPVNLSYDSTILNYSIYLPIVPDNSHVFPEVWADKLGIHILTVYNDSNNNGVWDQATERIIATKLVDGIPLFVDPLGDATDTEMYGWIILDELTDDSTIMDFATASQNMDFSVASAPVYEPTINGEVLDASVLGASNVRAAFYVVDGTALIQIIQAHGNPMILTYDSTYSRVLLDTDVQNGLFEGDLPDIATILSAAEMEAWKFTMSIGATATLEELIIMSFYYEDDGDGEFTTDDTPLGMATSPGYGGENRLVYTLHFPIEFNFWHQNLVPNYHYGYNHWATRLRRNVINISNTGGNNYDLTLDEVIAPNQTDIDFEIFAPDDGEIPVAFGVFSTTTAGTIIDVSCPDCNNVNPGDQFYITEVYTEDHYLDWKETILYRRFN